jgi:hypothetical protein
MVLRKVVSYDKETDKIIFRRPIAKLDAKRLSNTHGMPSPGAKMKQLPHYMLRKTFLRFAKQSLMPGIT